MVRTVFVMEQALGHVTHYRNLRSFTSEQRDIVPTWLPIPFEVRGPARLVPWLRSNWSVRASWRARRALDATLARQRVDALVFHTQVTALFSHALIRSLPSIISLDATPIGFDSVGLPYGHRPAGTSFLDRQKYRLNQRAFHAATALVTWSEWARRSLVEDYGVDPESIRVLAPGAAPSFFKLGEQRGYSATARVAERRPRALFVGGDFHRKGGAELLECMRGPLGEQCELHVVTQDHVAPQPNVYVHRDVRPNSAELLRLFAEADVFVLPSRGECLAVVLMEATAAGLPVITTDVAALSEAVVPGHSGLLIRAGDVPSLSAAMTTLVEDPQRRSSMGRVGHELARRKFDSRANNRALLDLVVEVTQQQQTRSRRAA